TDLNRRLGSDLPHQIELDRLPRPRAVEVDHVQQLRSRPPPVSRHRHRVVAVDGLLCEVAAQQAHATPALQVDGRDDLHGAPLKQEPTEIRRPTLSSWRVCTRLWWRLYRKYTTSPM